MRASQVGLMLIMMTGLASADPGSEILSCGNAALPASDRARLAEQKLALIQTREKQARASLEQNSRSLEHPAEYAKARFEARLRALNAELEGHLKQYSELARDGDSESPRAREAVENARRARSRLEALEGRGEKAFLASAEDSDAVMARASAVTEARETLRILTDAQAKQRRCLVEATGTPAAALIAAAQKSGQSSGTAAAQ